MRHARRLRGSGPNIDAVSRVLVEHVWANHSDSDPAELRSLKDRVRRALGAEVFTSETAQLFIDAFDLRADHAAELRQRLLSPALPSSLDATRHRSRTLSMQELHVIGPDGLPVEHRTIHTIAAVSGEVDGYTYTFDTSAVEVRAVSGASAGPIEPSEPNPGYWQCVFSFDEPLQPDDVRIFEYVTRFAFDEPPEPQFRRGAASLPLWALSMRVQFDAGYLPRSVQWCEWDDHTSGKARVIEQADLDGSFAVHRFVSSLHDQVVGFTWDW